MYQLQETILNLPAPQTDRSVNVLGFIEPNTQTPFQLIVNRDELIGEESIEQCFDRQIGLLTRQVKQFKLLRRSTTERPAPQQPIHMVATSFIQAGRTQYQLQTMLRVVTPGKLLVFTLASSVPMNDGHHAFWSKLIMPLDPALVAGS